jgi:toxin ParE1/3/4
VRLRWTPAAAADLEHISEHLRQHHARYRQPKMRKLYELIRSLKQWPHRGRPGSEDGIRELVFAPLPYVVIYRINEEFIEILRIYHGSQNRP